MIFKFKLSLSFKTIENDVTYLTTYFLSALGISNNRNNKLYATKYLRININKMYEHLLAHNTGTY